MKVSEKYDLLFVAAKAGGRSLRIQFAIVVALISITAISQALGPLGLRTAVNALTATDVNRAILGTCFYAAIIWLGRAAQARLALQFGYLWRPLRKAITVGVYDRILTADGPRLAQRGSGEISQIISSGLSGIRTTLRACTYGVVPTIIQSAAVLAVIVYVGRYEFFVAIAGFILSYGLVFHFGTRRQMDIQRQAADADTRTAGLGSEMILGQESIRLFGIQDRLRIRLLGSLEDSEQKWKRFNRRQETSQQVLILVFVGVLATILILSVHGISSGTMNVGDFVLINAYLFQIIAPIERLSSASRELLQGLVHVEKLFLFLAQEAPGKDLAEEGEKLRRAPLSLRVLNVWFGYDPHKPVLRGVGFEIEAGSAVAVVGKSGSGKSTLWRLICRLYAPEKGEIEVGGLPAGAIDLDDFRRSVSVVQQENTIYNATILENITLWDDDIQRAHLDEIIQVVGLDKLICKLPKGVDTRIGERGFLVSGGERQRITLARALFRKPQLLILDEATSALDVESEAVVLRNIACSFKDMTKLIITHRISTALRCDKILVLDGGIIAEQGVHHDLLALSGKYSALWNVQNGSVYA